MPRTSEQTHDDLEPYVEAAKRAQARMGETGKRIEDRDAKYHTGGGLFLLRMALLMRS